MSPIVDWPPEVQRAQAEKIRLYGALVDAIDDYDDHPCAMHAAAVKEARREHDEAHKRLMEARIRHLQRAS